MQIMKNVILIVFSVFFTTATAAFTVKLLEPSDGVVSGTFSSSVILSLPPCNLKGEKVDLVLTDTAAKITERRNNTFKVPECRVKRELIQVSQSNGQGTQTENVGYRVTDLKNGTTYSLQYIVGKETSNAVTASTRRVTSYTKINDGLPGRSAAMIVIVVILSVAMFVLIVGLIVALFFGSSED